jgi:hemoglobin
MKRDIENKEDIALLVNEFYGKVLKNDLLKPFFARLDFGIHKPKMVSFWAFALLDEAGYSTDVMQKHASISLKSEHFEKWLSLFNATVDNLFEGEKAAMAKQRAAVIGWTMESKMK